MQAIKCMLQVGYTGLLQSVMLEHDSRSVLHSIFVLTHKKSVPLVTK